MWSFILGLMLGVAAKAVYDLFKEEQLPTPMGLNAGRIEAMLDETSRTVRELRDELRQAASGEGSLQEKAGRVLSAAGQTVATARGGKAESGAESGSGDGGLKLTGSEASGSGSGAPSSGGPEGQSSADGGEHQQTDGGSGPSATHGTIHTMS